MLERLVEKGKVVAKRAYADWGRFDEYRTPLHELGIELIEIPERGMTGKNSADIRLVVDAMELSLRQGAHRHLRHRLGRLRLHAARAAGSRRTARRSWALACGTPRATCSPRTATSSSTTRTSAPPAGGAPALGDDGSAQEEAAFKLLFDTIEALQRENVARHALSLVKDTMKRKQPQFSEQATGTGRSPSCSKTRRSSDSSRCARMSVRVPTWSRASRVSDAGHGWGLSGVKS